MADVSLANLPGGGGGGWAAEGAGEWRRHVWVNDGSVLAEYAGFHTEFLGVVVGG